MRYIDVCSGISAPTMAWKPLGWEALCFAEIEAAPRAVLAHHYPNVPLRGDFTEIAGTEYGPVDLLVGGTPCQDFSVAGLRAGLDGERGNLSLEFLRLADRARPRWMVWENVPGVLSIDGGRAFGAILGGMVELGYGVAYRVLDAQHFGVPQRRRRVFVVGYLGDWRRAAAVLFERHSLSGHPAPRREARKVVAALTADGVGTCGADDNQGQAGHLIPSTGDTAHCLNAGGMGRQDYETETLIASLDLANMGAGGNVGWHPPERPTITLDTNGNLGIAHSLRAEGFDASEDGTGRGTPLVPVIAPTMRSNGDAHSGFKDDEGLVAFGWQNSPSQGLSDSQHTVPTLDKSKTPAVALMENQRAEIRLSSQTDSLACGGGKPGQGYPATFTGSAVRRLTPRECERLQGFPDDFTLVPYRGKPMADGPRYKMLGNSMAVPVVRWIGERIATVEAIAKAERIAA